MLIDAHVHMAMNGLTPRPQWHLINNDEKVRLVRELIRQYKQRGIAAARDGGDNASISQLVRELAASEGFIYKTPIYALYKTGCYGSFLGKGIPDIDCFNETYRVLLSQKPDHLKIILTGIVNFKRYGDVGETAFSKEELEYMVETARQDNLPVMVHANGSEGVRRAIDARVTTIEHGYLMTEAELHGMAEHGIVWVPTLSPLGNLLSANDIGFMAEMETIRRVFEHQLKNIELGYRIGVKIALGSDAGAYGVSHGSGLLDEVKHFKRIGFSRQQIERMCMENGKLTMGIIP